MPARRGKRIRILAGVLVGFALVLAAAAQTPDGASAALNPKLVRKYAELNAKANTQQGHKQAETLAQLAALDFTFAHTSFSAQDTDGGVQHLDAATQHADRACALLHDEAKNGKTDGMQKVEETLQKITYGLRGLAESVDFEQQARVKQAVEHFTNLRYELLQWMFAPKR